MKVPSRLRSGLRRRWFRKCQWKQVNGLCWLHLCCTNRGHCSVLNSFRYLKRQTALRVASAVGRPETCGLGGVPRRNTPPSWRPNNPRRRYPPPPGLLPRKLHTVSYPKRNLPNPSATSQTPAQPLYPGSDLSDPRHKPHTPDHSVDLSDPRHHLPKPARLSSPRTRGSLTTDAALHPDTTPPTQSPDDFRGRTRRGAFPGS